MNTMSLSKVKIILGEPSKTKIFVDGVQVKSCTRFSILADAATGNAASVELILEAELEVEGEGDVSCSKTELRRRTDETAQTMAALTSSLDQISSKLREAK